LSASCSARGTEAVSGNRQDIEEFAEGKWRNEKNQREITISIF